MFNRQQINICKAHGCIRMARNTHHQNANFKKSKIKKNPQSIWVQIRNEYTFKNIVFNPNYINIVMFLLFIFEILLNIFIINRIKCELSY